MNKTLASYFPKAKLVKAKTPLVKGGEKFEIIFDENLTLYLDLWLIEGSGICRASFLNLNNSIEESPLSWHKTFRINDKTFFTEKDLIELKESIEIELAKPRFKSFNKLNDIIEHSLNLHRPISLFEKVKVKLGF